MISRPLVELIAESFADVRPQFDSQQFVEQAMDGLEQLELSPRAAHVAAALAAQLPTDFDETAPILISSLGPPLSASEGNGLAPFFYLPHSHLIASQGVNRFESGMQAIHELTRRFTAEFCMRPFIVKYPQQTLQRLQDWVTDPSPHVRRLISEGTRPRLPWGIRLRAIQEEPALTLPLLEQLKDDSELYVRRSVANHLADLLKDHPEQIFQLCHQWIAEVNGKNVPRDRTNARFWMIRHAVRLPAKKGDATALKLRQLAASPRNR